MLEASVVGRRIRRAAFSRLRLRSTSFQRGLAIALADRTIRAARRHGKYLLIDLSEGRTVISHLGMSGRWLFFDGERVPRLDHVHVRLAFHDGSQLWFQDPRRFGAFRLVETRDLARDPSLALLGPDPLATPPTAESLAESARGLKAAVKLFLLDQRRLAGIGNIYASEILHRARIHPARASGSLTGVEWSHVAAEIGVVLNAAVDRMGTTFSMYRTLWNEPGAYGEQLLVYDRAGETCRTCQGRIRRIVQGQRSTFYCPHCQSKRSSRSARG
jgi:formamidopyrimidine-DNA glycosylase